MKDGPHVINARVDGFLNIVLAWFAAVIGVSFAVLAIASAVRVVVGR